MVDYIAWATAMRLTGSRAWMLTLEFVLRGSASLEATMMSRPRAVWAIRLVAAAVTGGRVDRSAKAEQQERRRAQSTLLLLRPSLTLGICDFLSRLGRQLSALPNYRGSGCLWAASALPVG
jgi:hypothetical protein